MTHTITDTHDTVIELLPWYANATLNADEQSLVQQHLPICTECQQQLSAYQQLSHMHSHNHQTPGWEPSNTQFAKILSTIDELEAQASTQKLTPPAPVKPSWWCKAASWFKSIPLPVYGLLTLETAALALLLVQVGIKPLLIQPDTQLFQTLSNESSVLVSNDAPQLALVFAEDITELEMRTLLQAHQAQIIQGPSAMGVYTLQLPKQEQQELQQAITTLRNSPKIKLVELNNRG